MKQVQNQAVKPPQKWVSLSQSTSFLLTKPRLLSWAVLLVLVTILLTWGGFLLTTGLLDDLTGTFFSTPPEKNSIWGWFKYCGWVSARWLFLVISRMVSFFLAFLAAYSLSTPLYAFLSASAENLYSGGLIEDEKFTFSGVLRDLAEGIKIGAFGIIVTIVAIFLGFIPLVGQAAVILTYTLYATLMFIDYPASRRRWSLGEKLYWIRHNLPFSIRLGIVPALLSMVPLVNIFFMAIIFPLFTVHSTLNFYETEVYRMRYQNLSQKNRPIS